MRKIIAIMMALILSGCATLGSDKASRTHSDLRLVDGHTVHSSKQARAAAA